MAAEPHVLGGVGLTRRLLTYLRPHWGRGLLVVLALLVELAFNTYFALSFKVLIDQAIIPQDYDLLVHVVVLLVTGFVVASLAAAARLYLSAVIGAAMANAIRLQMFEKLQQLSPSFFARTPSGDLLSRFANDLAAVELAIVRAIPRAVLAGMQLCVTVVLLFLLDWRLTLITLLTLPLTLLGPKVLGARATAASYERKQDQARLSSLVQEQIAAQQLVRAFGLQAAGLSQLQEKLRTLGRSSTRADFLAYFCGTTTGMAVTLVQLLVVSGGAFLAFNGYLSIGSIVSFVSLLLILGRSLVDLSQAIPDWLQATGGMQRIDDLLAEPVQVADLPDAHVLGGVARELRFDDVVFGYSKQEPILKNLCFTVPAGRTVAFVGRSGSGKSTILSLLARFFDPDRGTVSIDGQDLRQVSQQSLRQHLGIVFQESFLFDTTIRENIRLARPTASDAEVEQAARIAEIHDGILALPDGYETQVGERGGNLSGGQRQRIALARAILRDPAVLVLDEATSALDPETEAAVSATIERLGAGRMVISVTHRLASIARADRIFFIDAGQIVEEGAHQELLAAGGRYYDMWQQQTGFILGRDSRAAIETSRLRLIPLFASVREPILASIASRFASERYPAERIVFHEGDAGDRFYVIAHGSVEVLWSRSDGEQERAATLQDGEFFGEIALLADAPRSATIRTLTPCTFLSLPRDQFLALMDELPELHTTIERIAADRTSERTTRSVRA
jgi:ATP-binding cassette subfamily B protein